MSGAFLEFEDVRVVRGGKCVLEIPSLAAARGSVTVLFGDNGAGKTSLLMAGAGLLDLQSGRVRLFGTPFHAGRAPAPKELRRQLAFVFQDPYLFRRSVLSNLTYGLKVRGVAKKERRRRAGEVLERLDIAAFSQRSASELSGGESKLVALARALVLGPRALFLDEVTASLDDGALARVLEVITAEVEGRGTSILMATHLEGVAERLGARSVLLRSGRIAD